MFFVHQFLRKLLKPVHFASNYNYCIRIKVRIKNYIGNNIKNAEQM